MGSAEQLATIQVEAQELPPVIDLRAGHTRDGLQSRQHGRDARASAEARRGASGEAVEPEREDLTHSAQQLIFETSLKNESATIFSASAIVG